MKKAHIVGIGGIAMSAIAQCLLKSGYEVTGSDLSDNQLIRKLRSQGVKISIGHKAENIDSNIEKIIYSDAIPEDNVEIKTAKNLNLELLGRSQALEWITKEKIVISASGTHGKTTTSSLIAHLLEEGAKKPSFIIGGILNNFGSNFRASKGNYFVLEGDEYGKSFLKYPSDIGVIANIEFDHPDIYRDMKEVLETYKEYVSKLSKCLITNYEVIKQLNLSLVESDIDIITVGINDNRANFNAKLIREKELSSYFILEYEGEEVGEFKINSLGEYNVKHALEAMAVGNYIGLSWEKMKLALESWSGVKRRFEILEDNLERIIITDYAHHPSEVDAVSNILERIKTDKKKVIIFQPHQYIRTKSLFEDYRGILNKNIDQKNIFKIYKVREVVSEEEITYLGRRLTAEISEDSSNYFEEWEELRNYLDEYAANNKAIYLFLGAGNIDDFARDWAGKEQS